MTVIIVFWIIYALTIVSSITCMVICTVSLVKIARRLGELVEKIDAPKRELEER